MTLDAATINVIIQDGIRRFAVGGILIDLVKGEIPFDEVLYAIEKVYKAPTNYVYGEQVLVDIVGTGTWWVDGEKHRVNILKEAKTDTDFWFVWKNNEIKLMPFGGIHEYERKTVPL
jgi:hypothetical protein